MRTIIAGSRKGPTAAHIDLAMSECGWSPTIVVSGRAPGADRLGEDWAVAHQIPIDLFPANWKRYGNAAGCLRNTKMAENADALVAIWDGQSNGTRHMISEAHRLNLRVYVYVIPNVDAENF